MQAFRARDGKKDLRRALGFLGNFSDWGPTWNFESFLGAPMELPAQTILGSNFQAGTDPGEQAFCEKGICRFEGKELFSCHLLPCGWGGLQIEGEDASWSCLPSSFQGGIRVLKAGKSTDRPCSQAVPRLSRCPKQAECFNSISTSTPPFCRHQRAPGSYSKAAHRS